MDDKLLEERLDRIEASQIRIERNLDQLLYKFLPASLPIEEKAKIMRAALSMNKADRKATLARMNGGC